MDHFRQKRKWTIGGLASLSPYDFIYLDESQYYFHGLVMKIAEPGFEVEFATKLKFAAQLFFVLLICVKF